jgi:isopentenyl-diphosphate delta-isomerase
MDQVVIVNENDEEIGLKDKVEAHLGSGALHRAFVVIVFNSNGEILIHQRSAEKMLWPLVWDNACASHPQKGESYEAAGERRLTEELGFTCKLELVDKFEYHAMYKDVGAESELCATLIGKYDGEAKPNPAEIADWKWVSEEKLKEEMEKNSEIYTPWFIIALKRLNELKRI